MRHLTIDSHRIGDGEQPFVIAEVSGNHGGSLDRALDIVRAAAESGAHAVKLQTYRPETMTIESDAPGFRLSDGHELWGGRTLWDLYTQAHTPSEWHAPIFELARSLGLVAFSSPFDATAVDLLESLDVPAYKIASSEIIDLPLIERVAKTGKPLILSTGMASVAEIAAAVDTARAAGCTELALLSCTANYPADPADSNLRGLRLLADTFDVVVGLSDHTLGVGAALASVALGGSIVEKHLTLSRDDGGVDSAFSLLPGELALLVRESAVAARALGDERIGAVASEREGLRFRRSLYVVADVRAGDRVTPETVRAIRPAGGLAPELFGVVEGRTFTRDVPRGTALDWALV
ncbi:pseudaminic acid synthase [Flexivirga sp. ID2601S]|uniref:Pseudaminic acid synthase n=1 Tax=Flexivirga aerilata TaxID=1656889 RepID=A0A849AH64_9MICO|nr:pseudaminic acid synthase [Flexivirga aerilata]NNG38906.1 pseudaminic acid synthase [Flexivirga aerilata]